jgi:hypothetical protein
MVATPLIYVGSKTLEQAGVVTRNGQDLMEGIALQRQAASL